jgi:peroxiredoxin
LNRIIFSTVIFLFAVSCGKANASAASKESKKNQNKTKTETVDSIKAPDFTFKDLEGKEHTLSDYKGQVVLLNFWTIYCPSCRREIASLKELYKKHKDKGLVILGIGIDKSPDRLKAFSKLNDINYTVLLADIAIAKTYSLKGVPTTFIMNKEGELTDTILGYNHSLAKKIEEKSLKLLEDNGNEEKRL